MPEIHHELIYISGHVQGVGFRYTTLQVSREFELSGYVKNLFDGRVLIEVEGAKKEVDGLIAALHERMHGHIRTVERIVKPRAPEFQGFVIR